MKRKTTTTLVPARQARPEAIDPEIVEETALTVSFRMPKVKGKTPGARINFLHRLSVSSGKLSIAAGIMAGWELSRARAACDHGQWLTWLKHNTEITDTTARNYMEVYAKTLGAARASLPRPVPADTPPSAKEVAAASANVEAKSLSALYAQLRLLKRSDNHGGDRRAAAAANGKHVGRPSKGSVGEQLDAALSSAELAWKKAETHLQGLEECFPGDESVASLNDERLGRLFAVLSPLCALAQRQIEARLKGNGKGMAGAFAAEVGNFTTTTLKL